jgi:hypothetical protein
MIRVGIVTNPLDPSTWQEHETHNVHELIAQEFPSWPSTARIYDLADFGDWTRAAAVADASVLSRRDVTPPGVPGPAHDAAVDRLGELPGPLLVIVPPADPITAIFAVVAIAVAVGAVFLFLPRIPTNTQRASSPNNSLSSRTNQQRVNGRVADIFGTVEATPDLLAFPYVLYLNNQQVEVGFMCLGRGAYDVSRVRDGDTSIASISGSSAAIYAPYTSPNSGVPQLQIGPAITDPVLSVVRLNDVNGATLKPTNVDRLQGEDNIRFVYPDTIQIRGGDNLTDYFSDGDAINIAQANISGEAGQTTLTADARFNSAGEIEFDTIDPRTYFNTTDPITVSNAGYAGDDGAGGVLYVDLSGTYPIASLTGTKAILNDPASINSDWDKLGDYPSDRTDYRSVNFSTPTATAGINLNGNYTIATVSGDTATLNNPALVNSAWLNLADLVSPDDGAHATAYVSPSLSRNTESWVGPFIVDLDDATEILANFVSLNGLYTLSKKKGKQSPLSVGVELEVTPVNQNDAAIGPAELFPATLVGDVKERTVVGLSVRASPTATGRCSVRARRTTPTPEDDDYGAIVDEVKWEACYGLAPVTQEHFGDMTTVHTRTVATPGALAVKERKLNMRVTRRLPQRISGSTFGTAVATNNVADIIAAMCLDPYIGRRSPDEVDFDNLYDTVAEVMDYFGAEEAGEFGYTFDDTDVSFEETLATVASAIFCRAYRQGRVIRLAFERATEAPSLIFNARNIMPGSQTRSFRFGIRDDHDGVELDYIDATDGAPLTLAIPENRAATSAQSLEVVGVRSYLLAYWQAWRAWNKIRYQNVAVELEATQEAVLVLPQDRVMIADRTRPNVLQGEVEAEDGTTLTLSHPAELPGVGWTIFLQHIDGTVEPLGVSAGVDEYHVEVSAAPRMPLSVDAENFARATYMIVPEGDVQTRAFLVSEREPNSNFTETVRAVNYSFLYYQNDELRLWLPFTDGNFYDYGPYRHDGAATGSLSTIMDTERNKVVAQCGGGSLALPGFNVPQAYTKAAWLKPAGLSGDQFILQSTGLNERFFLTGNQLQAAHNTSAVSTTWPNDGAWHHAAATFDPDDGEAILYLDGRRVSASTLTTRTTATQTALSGFTGRVDDVRVWKRALSPEEVLSVYRGSKAGGA